MGLEPIRRLVRGPEFARIRRFGSVSIATSLLGLALLYLFLRVARIGSAATCNVAATVIATVPSYYFTRNWVWGRSGRSHLWREVVPFWVVAIVSLVATTGAVDVAAHEAHHLSRSHGIETGLVLLANVIALSLLWIVKFVVFNRVLFSGSSNDRTGTAPLVTPAENRSAPLEVVARDEPVLAGWYPDPIGDYRVRWWDGERWTRRGSTV